LQTEESKILIDLGLSLKDLERRLALIGIAPSEIDAVLISHEHSDHIRGINALTRRFGTKVYINYPTLKEALKKIKKLNAHEFDSSERFTINDVTVTPFSVSHDAVDPVGFTLSVSDKRIGIATDLGVATNLVRTNLSDCDLLVIESNHDSEMLMNGPYPWFLKQRVRSRHGHLSNEAALNLLSEVAGERTKHVICAHLSETNNNEEKVGSNVVDLYKKKKRSDLKFIITSQVRPAKVVEV
jgi:phosphoribosyl 1,2-cyclic phosphodiesterase